MMEADEGRLTVGTRPCCRTRACAGAAKRRQHIIETARSLFADRGHNATGIARIADASGIRVGQIYRDFCSKECIVVEVFDAYLSTTLMENELTAAIARHDRPGVRKWLAGIIAPDHSSYDRRIAAEIFLEALRNPHVLHLYANAQRRNRSMLMRALSFLWDDRPSTSACWAAAELVMTMSPGLVDRRIVDPDWDSATVVQWVNQQLERLLSPS